MENFEYIFLFLALSGAVISSITDIKKGIIPNRLTLPLIGFGLAGNLFFGIMSSDLSIFFNCLLSVGSVFILGYIFWLVGGWSAGDVKEFMFIGALLPRYPGVLKGIFHPSLGPYPFVLTVVINTFLVIFPFIAVYSLITALVKVGAKNFLTPLKDVKKIGINALALLGIVSFSAFSKVPLLTILVLFILAKIKQGHRVLLSIIFILFYLAFGPSTLRAGLGFLAIYFLFSFFVLVVAALLINSFKVFRAHVLQHEKAVSDLEEGDVLGEEIYMLDGRVIKESRGLLEKAREIILQKESPPYDKRQVAGTAAAGITKKEVKELKRLVEEGKLEDKVKVKKSMPFAPIILAGLVISLILGDLGVIMRSLYG